MKCERCSSVALYQVKALGFCKKHYVDAQRASAAEWGCHKAAVIRSYRPAGMNMAFGGGSVKTADHYALNRWTA